MDWLMLVVVDFDCFADLPDSVPHQEVFNQVKDSWMEKLAQSSQTNRLYCGRALSENVIFKLDLDMCPSTCLRFSTLECLMVHGPGRRKIWSILDLVSASLCYTLSSSRHPAKDRIRSVSLHLPQHEWLSISWVRTTWRSIHAHGPRRLVTNLCWMTETHAEKCVSFLRNLSPVGHVIHQRFGDCFHADTGHIHFLPIWREDIFFLQGWILWELSNATSDMQVRLFCWALSFTLSCILICKCWTSRGIVLKYLWSKPCVLK